MKFTILGFSQEMAIKYNLDLIDLLILRWFIDFKDSGRMDFKIIENDKYYWVKYSKAIEDIPIINLKIRALQRRLLKLSEIGILKHYTVKENGTFPFYAVGDNYKYLICIPDNSNYGSNTVGFKSPTPRILKSYPLGLKNPTKDKSIIDTSIKDIQQQQIELDNLNTKNTHNEEITGVNTPKKDLIKVDNGVNRDDIQEVIDKFRTKYNGELASNLVKRLILQKGKDKVLKCIDELEQYVSNADKIERVFYDFVMNYENYTKKGTVYSTPNHNKPIQATNYEQREYTDEYFDSLPIDLDKWQEEHTIKKVKEEIENV
jgi:hypothetical protein